MTILERLLRFLQALPRLRRTVVPAHPLTTMGPADEVAPARPLRTATA